MPHTRPRLAFNLRWLSTPILTLLALGAAAYAVLPMVLVLAGSLESQPQKIFSYWDPLSFRAFIPPGLTGSSYSSVLAGSFGTALLNSIIVAVSTVVLGLIMSILAAYALAVLRFRFREAVFALVVVSFLIPFDAVSIPLSGTFRSWGLSNSLVGLVLPGLANGFAVFLLRQFFLDIPGELVDAARIDGMSHRQIIVYIFLPLARAAIIGAGLLLFLAQWQEYLWPLLTITTTSRRVVSKGVRLTGGRTD